MMLTNNLAKYKWQDPSAFASVFALSMLFGWLLFLAYPEGITDFETPRFWVMQNRFKLFEPNELDWWCTVGYGLIIKACYAFARPTAANYWFNNLLFSIDTGLVYLLGRSLFLSIRVALMFALTSLVFEFASMRIFFSNLFVTADQPYAEFVFMGILLSFIGWLQRKQVLFMVGYFILGIASYIKPVGISLFPVWIGFAVFVWRDWRSQALKDMKLVVISCLLLLAPLTFWSVRNYFVYGYLKNSGGAGTSLLKATLSLMSDQDQLLSDPKANAEFIAAVRRTERSCTSEYFAQLPSDKWSWFWHQQYFFEKESVLGPFDYLAGVTSTALEVRLPVNSDSKKMFALDGICARIGLRLVAAHPYGYLQRVLREYTKEFDSSKLPPDYFEKYQSNSDIPYQIYSSNLSFINASLYPGLGKPDTRLCNKGVAVAIGNFCDNSFLRRVLSVYYENQLWLTHLIFLGACISYGYAQCFGKRLVDCESIRRVSIVLLFLFLTVASYAGILALVEQAQFRLAISGGDLELHLMFFIALFASVLHCGPVLKSIRQRLSVKIS